MTPKEFNEVQKERLIVERDLEFWAKRFNHVTNENIKKLIDAEVDSTIYKYKTQIDCKDYHLRRYEKLKRFYSKNS